RQAAWSAPGAHPHRPLVAMDADGLRNLCRLASRASLEGNYRKWARMDRELLAEHARGLVATTSCPSGEVQTRLRLGQVEQARQAAADLRDIFGAENFFCGGMEHGLEIEDRVRGGLLGIAADPGPPLRARHDLHHH